MHLALLDIRPRLIAWELVSAAATLTAAQHRWLIDWLLLHSALLLLLRSCIVVALLQWPWTAAPTHASVLHAVGTGGLLVHWRL